MNKKFIFDCNFPGSMDSNGHHSRQPSADHPATQLKPSEGKTPMTKAKMKSLLMTAAMSGLLTGATTTVSAATTNSGANSITARPGPVLLQLR